MKTANAQPLEAFFRRVENLDWRQPEQCLQHAALEQRKFGQLAGVVGRYLSALNRETLADIATRSTDGPVRLDVMLYRPDNGTFECSLKASRPIYADSVTSQAWINRKGHWLLTTILTGRMSVTNYRFSGFGDPDHFPDIQLDHESDQIYVPGQSFILAPKQIHQITAVDSGTVSMTIRPTTVEGPMRVYHRNMHRIVTEDMVMMPERILALAKTLIRSSTPS